ncbi:MAG: sigma 54-interacting transcriptional regulator [Tissierellia bacterium]|nr:sigma 54-interacting transcriptional regulator [Tissierellia bacterium]
MKKKTLIFFANDIICKDFNTQQLKDFFEDTIDIESYTINDDIDEKSISGDLVLAITPTNIDHIRNLLVEDIDIIGCSRTILVEKFNILKTFPKGTSALVYNIDKRAAFDLASFLLYVGIDNLDCYPYSDAMGDLPDTEIIIIPTEFESNCVLDKNKIINLNSRRITVETYRTIMLMMDIVNEKLEKKLIEYSSKLTKSEYSTSPVTTYFKTEKVLNTTINEIDYGIITLNNENKIIYVNKALLNMFNIKDHVSFQYLSENILPKKTFNEILNLNNVDFKIITVAEINKKFILSKKSIILNDNRIGSIITLKDITKIEKLELELRGLIAEKGYKARYTFDDIIGNSNKLNKSKEIAKKMAVTDKTILVFGESGTGKEMFVQAIHNYSQRKNKPFVAINCASLSSDLLASELFGYEEGSFTGAKKGGKKGLFELAHRGSIFLDEIGDISEDVQIKLLRVLQEKEIRKIGGDNTIPIDVRVITATHRDLEQMVKEGKFRLDLYYRLNAFTLNIPPLRERKQDIPLIIKDMIKQMDCQEKKFDDKLMKIFMEHTWNGNVRELINYVEYMLYMGQDILTIDDLPPNFSKNSEQCLNNNNSRTIDGFTKEETDILISILKIVRERNVGRVLIHKILLDYGHSISEYKLRTFMSYLNKNDYITYGGGRKGANITKKGIMLVEKCEFNG